MWGCALDDLVRRNDQVDLHVVIGDRNGCINHLEAVNRGHDEGAGSDEASFRRKRELQVGIAGAFADPGTVPIDCDTRDGYRMGTAGPRGGRGPATTTPTTSPG